MIVDDFSCRVVLTSEELLLLYSLVSEPLKHCKTRRLIKDGLQLYESLKFQLGFHVEQYDMYLREQVGD